MADLICYRGLGHLYDWETALDGIYKLLLTTTVDPISNESVFLDDVAFSEPTGGYTRVDVLNRSFEDTWSLLDGDHFIYKAAFTANFGAITLNEDIKTVVLYKFVTNDSDSIPIAMWSIGPTIADGRDFFISFDNDVCFKTRQGVF